MPTVVDRDTQEVMDVLRAAMTSSGLSQTAFARALGTSVSRLSTYLNGTSRPSAHLVMRARRLGSALSSAATAGLMSAPVTAAAMRRYYLAGDESWVWRMLLQGRDHLRLVLTSREQDLIDSWEAVPASVGEKSWDALLAAITQHEFDQADLAPPNWSHSRSLEEPWRPQHPFLSPDRVTAQTPEWLSRLNIYVPERDLETA